jgi:hypothetical protein
MVAAIAPGLRATARHRPRATRPALAARLACCCGRDDLPDSVVPVARRAPRNDHRDAVGGIVAVVP